MPAHQKRDGGLTRLNVEAQLGDSRIYRWEPGHLCPETHSDDVPALRANPTLYQNVKEL